MITLAIRFLPFVFWAIFGLNLGFQDSMGRPRNTTVSDHIRVYAISLGPLLVPGALSYYWLRSDRRR